MDDDQAWPQAADFRAGGGFYELRHRCRDGLVAAGLALVAGRLTFELNAREIWVPLAIALPILLVGLWFPSRRLFGGESRLFDSEKPRTQQPESLLTPRQERRDLWAFFLVLGLAVITGLAGNLALLLLFAPLIAFRLGSRLWSEVDLLGGRVYYHRTFLGLQITRTGPGLEEAIGIVSGVKVDRPGEDPLFSVCAVLPGQEPLPLDCMSRSREESHSLGRRLGLQLNLPHEPVEFEVEARASQFRARTRWKPLALKENPAPNRDILPPVGPA